MRRLDSLEIERAMEEVRLLVKDGQLTQEQAQPVIQALFRRGMSEEADELFDQSCKRLAASLVVVEIEIVEAGDLPFELAPDNFGDDPSELGFDPYAGQYLDEE